MSAPFRILIIRLSSLGDILHTLPAFESLKASFPHAQIDWLVAERTKFLLSSVPGISSLHVLDTHHLLKMPPDRNAWRKLKSLILTLRAQQYDLAIDFQGLLKSALLERLSGASIRLGFSRELVRERPSHWFYNKTLARLHPLIHITELNQQLAELAGARPKPYHPNFIVSEANNVVIDSLLKKYSLNNFIVLNPGGGWPTKRWAPEKYGSLANKIQSELGLQVVVTTGPGEEQVVVTTGPGEEPLYRIIAESCRCSIPYHFPVSFLQLIPLLKKARLFVGGDTGPFHLACALDMPVVGIYGPTSPVRNGPWRIEEEVITHRLSCSPCYGRNCSSGIECMNITVDEVFDALMRRMNRLEKEPPFESS
jgi:heptosyltransferase I